MHPSWITLYDVTRDGNGIVPWILALLWVAAIAGGVTAIKKSPAGRLFVSLWLVFWVIAGGVGFGNVFYQYESNFRALRRGTCETTEGFVENFHRQNPMKKGDTEHFALAGREFRYSSANLGGGGLRSSAGFAVPLRDGLYIKVWHRHGIICRLDAQT